MRASTASCLIVAGCMLLTATSPAGAQAPQQEVCNIAAYIDYGEIKQFALDQGEDPAAVAGLPDTRELVFDADKDDDGERDQLCCVDLVGTPQGEDEKTRLTCDDLLPDDVTKPLRVTGFQCRLFVSRRLGGNNFAFTNNTSLAKNNQGRTTMVCTQN